MTRLPPARQPDPPDDEPAGEPDTYELASEPADGVDPTPTPRGPAALPGAGAGAGIPGAPKATGVRCAHCRYDLSGTSVGGNCPECGTPVAETIRQLQQRANGPAGETNTAALTCLVLGALSIPCCSWLGPAAIFFYVRAQNELKTGAYSDGSKTLATVGVICGAVGTLRMIAEALLFTFRMF